MESSAYRGEYIARVNRAIDHINANLGGDLSLQTLAAVANFSASYFHRIFKAITGETLNHFIGRARLARACFLLLNNPKQSITAIAYDCGFSSPATFARAFRTAFTTTAAEWRKTARSGGSAIRNRLDKDGGPTVSATIFRVPTTILTQSGGLAWKIEMTSKKQIHVMVKELPELNVAYLRHFGRYHQDVALFQRLFEKLMVWAAPRGLIKFPESQALTVFGGHPETSGPDKLRVDVCLTVPKGTVVAGEIGSRKISGGRYAIVHMEATIVDCYAAWDVVFNEWLPESGFQPDDRDYYLNHLNDPKTHPQNLHIVDMCIPVKPL